MQRDALYAFHIFAINFAIKIFRITKTRGDIINERKSLDIISASFVDGMQLIPAMRVNISNTMISGEIYENVTLIEI